MKFSTFKILFLVILCNNLNAQVLISDEANSTAINSDAMLELKTQTNTKGLLLPKVGLTATNISSPLPSHFEGMIVYNTTTSSTSSLTAVTPGIYYNDGTAWYKMDANLPSFGDIKYANISSDHEGWYLLDGRQLSSLSSNAQLNATNLGLSGILPNTADTFLKSKDTSETLGSIVSNNMVTLNKANLPNESYTANVNSAGTHNHPFLDRGEGTLVSGESSVTNVLDDKNTTNRTTSTDGAHTHTFTLNSGGSDTPLNITPKYLATNIFIYLGK